MCTFRLAVSTAFHQPKHFCPQAATAKKEADLQRKEELKLKAAGKALLGKVGIPYAKAESDLASLKSLQADHPLINELSTLLQTGAQLKQLAVKAMEGDAEAAASISTAAAQKFLDGVKKNSKVVSVLLKGK